MNQMFESFETAAFIFFFLIVVFFIGWFVYHEFCDWFLARKQKPKYGGQIPPVKNSLPPPPKLKNAMPRAVAPIPPERNGRYEPNDNGIIVWNTDEKSAPYASVDFAPPLDPPSYSSDSGSSNSDSSPPDFSGGDFGGGGAGGEY